MKILVIQLTRLGDVVCTLPTLSALRRENPGAQIHFLVRKTFSDAARLSAHFDHLWELDSKKVIEPLLKQDEKRSVLIQKSLTAVDELLSQLRQENFDKVINLSFSPSSSFITHLITPPSAAVRGYTRMADLYFLAPDRHSRYFRAHVGTTNVNRRHVVDIFADVAGVELKNGDLQPLGPVSLEKKQGIVCHLGASNRGKTWPIEYWAALLRKLIGDNDEKYFFIGGAAESELALSLEKEIDSPGRIFNLTGNLSLKDLAQLLGRSRLFIGADSGPLHLANLSGCVSICLSVGPVKFWETGPLVEGSLVCFHPNPRFLSPDKVHKAVSDFLEIGHFMPETGFYKCTQLLSGVRYRAFSGEEFDAFTEEKEIGWQITSHIAAENFTFLDLPSQLREAISQIAEAAQLGAQQSQELLKNPKKTEIIGILDRLDEVLSLIALKIPPVAPLVNHYFARKESIPPASREEIFYQTIQAYDNLVHLCEKLKRKEQAYDSGRTATREEVEPR